MFYDRFMALCEERGKSAAAVVRDIGLNNSAPTTWKRGSVPKGETLQKVADYFGVSVDYLLGLHHLKGIHEVEEFDILARIFKGIAQSGMSNEEFCKKLGLPFDEWFRWKEVSSTSYLDYIPQISELLNISEKELSGGYKKSPDPYSRLIGAFKKLNYDGRKKAAERVEELTEIPRYRAETAPQSALDSTEGSSTAPPPDALETPPEGE